MELCGVFPEKLMDVEILYACAITLANTGLIIWYTDRFKCIKFMFETRQTFTENLPVHVSCALRLP